MKPEHILWSLLIVTVLWTSTGCNLINPDEPEVAILHIEPFAFQIQPGQGSANNRITEVWLYANDNNIGTFSLPVDVHYLNDGQTRFVLRPGIRNNGIANQGIIYPMYNRYTQDINIEKGKTYTLQPVTSYLNSAQFSFLADFEINNPFTVDIDTFSGTQLDQSATDPFEGDYAGHMALTSKDRYVEVTHVVPMSGLPVDPSDVRKTYLELWYKCDTEFTIGLIGEDLSGQTAQINIYVVRPVDVWNELYLDLTGYLVQSGFPSYKLVFGSVYPNFATAPVLNIYLDNIKVVHL